MSNFFKKVVSFMKGGDNLLSPLEKKILNEVVIRLRPDMAEKFRQRISEVNFVQRLCEGREVNFFSMKNGKPWLNECTQIENPPGNSVIAKVYFSTGIDQSNNCCIYSVDGYLFSMEYEKPNKQQSDDSLFIASIDIPNEFVLSPKSRCSCSGTPTSNSE